MSLDISLKSATGISPIISLEDDDCYWWLCPFFESISKKTNHHIDLYGRASFSGQDLAILLTELERAKVEISQRDPKGVLYEGGLYEPIVGILDRMIPSIREAIDRQESILCHGD